MYRSSNGPSELRQASSPYLAFSQTVDEPQESALGLDEAYAASAASLSFQQLDALTGPSVTESVYALGKLNKSQVTAPARPLRVIHVSQFLMHAGIESWLRTLIRYSDRSQLQWVRCLVTSGVGDLRVARELGVPVEVGQATALRRAAQDCDVLLVSSPGDVAEWLGKIRPGLCVFVAHGDAHWSRSVLEHSRPLVEHVVAVSERVRESVAHDFPCSVIYNAADPSHIIGTCSPAEARVALGFEPDDFVLGYVGRFAPEKRLEAMIEAAANLPRRFKILLAGWGPLRASLMELANRLIPGRYAFADAPCNLGDLYRAMNAFCLVSDSEGFGLVLLEAMLCGVPVIAAPIGFAPEKIADRVNGLVVEGSPSSVAAAAQLLADHPRWAAAVGDEGRRLAESFGYPARMCREYERVLHELWAARQQVVKA